MVLSRPVLVVDDEVDLAATYERLLRRQGYEVVSAGTRERGLSVVQLVPLSLVISDIRLPDGDGLDIVRAARATSVPTPVIVITGFPSESERRTALDAGASAYWTKPFSTTAFTGLVQDILGGQRL